MTVLTPSGSRVITTVVSGLDVAGNVTIRSGGALLHSRIRGTLSVHGSGRAEHVEVNGLGAGFAVYAQGQSASVRATMRHLDIYNGSDGARFDGWVELTDSWIHDLARGPGAHGDGVQSTGGPWHTYRCNVVEGGNTSSFIIGNNGCGCGLTDHVIFDHNWFIGTSGPGGTTSYAVYAGGSDFQFTNNIFSRVGGTVWVRDSDDITVWTGNVYIDGAPVAKP